MAKSKETFDKRAKEQKRLKQRRDKAEKMEERKLNAKKGVALEEMLAYVDENGNITDKAPDPRQRKLFRVEDIQIGIPPGNLRESSSSGKLQFFNEEKGFGFIIDSKTQDRIFVHHSNLQMPVQLNDVLEYDIQNGERGLVAVNISKRVN